ncbi:MAG: hypothetical protein KIPDCIKN_03723 [Haliscomenobacter sp.]|jgi:hypothetical protein|nr:hypothetical protein [Haliscomenobacter sp.]
MTGIGLVRVWMDFLFQESKGCGLLMPKPCLQWGIASTYCLESPNDLVFDHIC